MEEKVLVLECAGLDVIASGFLKLGLEFEPVTPVFPAVTCVEQATMRTALPPREHGIVANGRFDRLSCRVDFWNQSARLYRGERIWEKARGKSVGVMFHQQSLGDDGVDYVFSPAPIHKHHGGMIMACHAQPPSLERELTEVVGRRFDLSSYWGPCASWKSSSWIAKATMAMMRSHAPNILYSYLPHLDYCLQREGPKSPNLPKEAAFLGGLLRQLLSCAKETGYEVLIWGDYAITEAVQPVRLNRVLLEAGLFAVRDVNGHLYANLHDSRAFAMADHQVAHIFIRNQEDVPRVREMLSHVDGVDSVQTPQEAALDCLDAGDLVATASAGAWFAYSWWERQREAPDYATHVDIHNKIGFDPCELFWGIPFLGTSQNLAKVKGTHGRIDTPAAFAVTDGLRGLNDATTILEIAQKLKAFLGEQN